MSDGMDYLKQRVIPWVPLKRSLTEIMGMTERSAAHHVHERHTEGHWLYGIQIRFRARGTIYVNADELTERWNAYDSFQERPRRQEPL